MPEPISHEEIVRHFESVIRCEEIRDEIATSNGKKSTAPVAIALYREAIRRLNDAERLRRAPRECKHGLDKCQVCLADAWDECFGKEDHAE